MFKFYFIILSFFYSIPSFGQINLDLNLIEKLTNDSTSEYYYNKLVIEFNNSPKFIDPLKAKYLYYGKLYTANYKMLQFNNGETKFNNLINNGWFKKAILVGEKILQEDPVNLDIISKLNFCYKKINGKENADTAAIKQSIIVNTILASGNGLEKDKAYKVVSIADEYTIMALLGVNGLSRQSLMQQNSAIDSWKIKDIKSGKKSEMHFEWLVNSKQNSKNMKWPD